MKPGVRYLLAIAIALAVAAYLAWLPIAEAGARPAGLP